jgi:hypothetical protein
MINKNLGSHYFNGELTGSIWNKEENEKWLGIAPGLS